MSRSPALESPLEQAALERFARALLDVLADIDPTLASKRKPRCLPSSVGSRNYLFRVSLQRGEGLLKLRSNPDAEGDAITAEGDALTCLPTGLAPALWTHINLDELRTHAANQKDIKTLKALELPIGSGLLMSWLGGETPMPTFSVEELHSVGEMLAHLHLHPLPNEETLPRHGFPRRPGSMLRVCDDHFEELQQRRVLTPETEERLNEAMDALHEHQGLKRLPPRPQHLSLIHGDLRWHNMLHNTTKGTNRWQLIDWEDAGIGDPAIDLALMASRIPLTWREELCILETYSLPPMPRSVVDRYFVIRPLVGMLCAMSAMLDLIDVSDGLRPTTEGRETFLARRWPAAEEELQDAIQRVLGVWNPIPPIETKPPQKTEKRRRSQALIAVDGPSVSFKSPFAAGLADALALPYYNKGALFRYVALWAYCHDKDPDVQADRSALLAHIKRTDLALSPDGAVLVNGVRIERALQLEVVEQCVASWAALPAIRDALQPIFAATLEAACVLEGRDVGTEFATHADVKLFVEAPMAARVEALMARSGATKKQAKKLIEARDQQDTQRETAPLRCAEDATTLKLSPEDIDTAIAQWAKQILQTHPVETP